MKKYLVFIPLILFTVLFVLLVSPSQPIYAATSIPTYDRGLNLFGGWQSGWGGTNTFANASQLDYYKSKGLNTFRVPILWEALQPTLNGPFDAAYLAQMDQLVANAQARSQKIEFTIINQGQRPANGGQPFNSSSVPTSAFVQFWQRMATHYLNVPTVYAYGLANEPWHAYQWPIVAQAAINGIRAIDANKLIIASPLDAQPFRYTSFAGYTGANIAYEAHVYADVCNDPSGWGQYSGTYESNCAYPNVMVDRVKPFVTWCEANNKQCSVTEYGVPGGWSSGDATTTYGAPNTDSRWLTVLDNLLSYLDVHHMSGMYWNAGPYGDVNSVEPAQGMDRPQMNILVQHLGTIAPHYVSAGSLVYNDDFTVPFDPTKYNTCYAWACSAGWNGELERYTTSQVTTHNGVLDLQAAKQDITAHNVLYHYVSGMVTTADHFSFQYGYTEIRFQLPKGQGFWPALWMLAQNGQPITELDMLEVLGNDTSTIHMGVHYADSNNKNAHSGTQYTGSDLSSGWHTIGVDWQADHITWYLDGVQRHIETNSVYIPHTPMYIIANLAVGGTWPGNPDSTTPFPSSMLLDYIRVYSTMPVNQPTQTPVPPTATATVQATNSPSPTVTPVVPTVTPTATSVPVTPTVTPVPSAIVLPTEGCIDYTVPSPTGYTETLHICRK